MAQQFDILLSYNQGTPTPNSTSKNVKTTVHRNVGDEIVVNHFGPSESVCAENAIHLYRMYQLHKNGTQPITLGTHFVTAISVNEA